MESVLKKMPDNSVDAVISDFPYGVRDDSEWDDKQHYIKNISIWINESLRVSKHTVIIFCASRMLPHVTNSIKDSEDTFRRLHFWNKIAGSQYAGASHNNIWYSVEPIVVLSKNWDITKTRGKDMPFGYDAFDYRTIPHATSLHTCAKPVSLIRKLLGHYTEKSEIILDPFAGSMTMAIAAEDMERRSICIEQLPLIDMPITDFRGTNPDHYGNGVKRVQRHLDTPRLFYGVNDIDIDSEDIDATLNLFEKEDEETNIQ